MKMNKYTKISAIVSAIAVLAGCSAKTDSLPESSGNDDYFIAESNITERQDESYTKPVASPDSAKSDESDPTIPKTEKPVFTAHETTKPSTVKSSETAAPKKTTVSSTKATSVATTKPPEPVWTESKMTAEMYVNTAGIYSRSKAYIGAPAVRQYALNEIVSIIAVTNTDYYKLSDGNFIHKDYLSNEKTVIQTTAPPSTSAPARQPQPFSEGKMLPSGYISSGYEPLDELIVPILDDIITNKMNDIEKLRAVYDYLIKFNYLERSLLIANSEKPYTEQIYAKWLLENKYGVCYDFSAAFKYMTRALGYDTTMIYGWHTSPSGTAGEHSWDELVIDGTTYIFDPSIELIMKSEGYSTTTRFMQTYSNIGRFYIK